jgi:hypothetical protein
MIVGTNPQHAKVDINNIMIGSTEVGKVPVVKYLGVWYYNNLIL